MPPREYTIYECPDPGCRFRFPLYEGERWNGLCPRCGKPTLAATKPLPLHAEAEPAAPLTFPARRPVEALLDNIRSTFNVGAMFRTADGAGLARLHLCGATPTPEHPKVGKTALGAEKAVPWNYHPNAVQAALDLKNQGYCLWALENGPRSQALFAAQPAAQDTPLLLMVGNEISGVDPALLALCDALVWIPMSGVKASLNVAIAFGVAAYYTRFF